MNNNKYKDYKILNNNLPLINMLLLITALYLGTIVSPWYFLLLILVVVVSVNIKINKWQILACVGYFIVFIILLRCVNEFSLFNKLSTWLKCDVVRNSIFNWLDNTYNSETSSFIKLILFGVKSKESYIFYKQTVDLGIVWLICVGGFHISFLSRLIYKITKKIWKVGKWIDLSILLIYSYLLKFSYSSMKVICMLLLRPVFSKFKIESYNKIGFIGLAFYLLNPSCLSSYSFLLSFIGSISAYFVLSLDIENKMINSILIGFFGFLSTIPFVISLNHKISLVTFINSFIFTYIFTFIFLYFLVFSWMPFMAIIHHGIIVACYAIMGNISYLNIYIKSNSWEPYIVFAFYMLYSIFLKLVYLIVKNNKI